MTFVKKEPSDVFRRVRSYISDIMDHLGFCFSASFGSIFIVPLTK